MTSQRHRQDWLLLLAPTALMILMLWSGCARKQIVIVQSDDAVVRLKVGTAYTPPRDGWYMTDSLYMRYRRAVADKIAENK